MLPGLYYNTLKQVALPLAKDIVIHNTSKQILRPFVVRGISVAIPTLNIQTPKLLGKSFCKYNVEFIDGMTKEKKLISIPQIFVNYTGNPLYMDDNTLKNTISKYLKIQDKCETPPILNEFLTLNKESVQDYDFTKLRAVFDSPASYNHKFYRGVRDLETGKTIALNSFLASKLGETPDCPSGNGIIPGFITTSFSEANEYSNKNSVVLEFVSISDKNQKTGPYGGSEYTTFDDIVKDGVVLTGVHKGSGEYYNKSAFSTNYD
jgi:hypothetical protein